MIKFCCVFGPKNDEKPSWKSEEDNDHPQKMTAWLWKTTTAVARHDRHGKTSNGNVRPQRPFPTAPCMMKEERSFSKYLPNTSRMTVKNENLMRTHFSFSNFSRQITSHKGEFWFASMEETLLQEGTHMTRYEQLHRVCLNLKVNFFSQLLVELCWSSN